MQISIDANLFANAIYKLLGVTNTKGPLTIVSNALLTANEDNTLVFEATDLEVTISTTMDCEVLKVGQLCLNAHNLYNVVKGLKNQKIEIVAQDNYWARLRSGDVDCKIVGVPPVEFPRLPSLGELTYCPVETDSLLEMVDRTIFSISTDEGRPNLMGANLVLQDQNLTMVSTDGHRLSKVVRAASEATEFPAELADGIIIPRKSLAELKRTVSGDTPNIEMAISGNNAIFRFDLTTIMVRLVDATFPDFNRVIPEESAERQATVDTTEFVEKLKFVSLFANSRTGNVTVLIDGETLQLTASDPEKGEGKESMPTEYSGPKVQVGFNYRYLLDILGVVRSPEFRFQVLDAYSAALVLDVEREEDLFLVMPMRL